MFLHYFSKNENKDKLIAVNLLNIFIMNSKFILKKILNKKEITFDDSFEIVSLLIICFFFATKYNKNLNFKKFNQEIMDSFTSDLDHSMRILGVGDTKIPKHVKHYIKKFYFRLMILEGIFLEKKNVDFKNYLIDFNLIPQNQEIKNIKFFFIKLLEFVRRIKHITNYQDIELIFNEYFN